MDANNLYGLAMIQKLPVDGSEWVEDLYVIDEDFTKNYDDDDSNVGYIIEADIEYPKNLQSLHSYLPFLPDIMKVNNCKKLVCNLYDKKTMLII